MNKNELDELYALSQEPEIKQLLDDQFSSVQKWFLEQQNDNHLEHVIKTFNAWNTNSDTCLDLSGEIYYALKMRGCRNYHDVLPVACHIVSQYLMDSDEDLRVELFSMISETMQGICTYVEWTYEKRVNNAFGIDCIDDFLYRAESQNVTDFDSAIALLKQVKKEVDDESLSA